MFCQVYFLTMPGLVRPVGVGSRAGRLPGTRAGANRPGRLPGRRNMAILSKCSRSGIQRETGQSFFLAGFIKPTLRKQRTGIFSQLSGNVPLKKKAPARLAAARDSKQRKSPENAFFHDKFAASSSASARVFFSKCLITPSQEQFFVRCFRCTRKIKV